MGPHTGSKGKTDDSRASFSVVTAHPIYQVLQHPGT